MAVTIVAKGDSLQLRGSKTMRNVLVGLGWDTDQGQSKTNPATGKPYDLDLDAAAVCRNAAGDVLDEKHICYYGNLVALNGAVAHQGDNLTGEGEGDDEQIKIQLDKLPADVVIVDLPVHIYEGAIREQTFDFVENAFIRLVNDETGEELVRTPLTESSFGPYQGIHFARLERSGSTWTYKAVGVAKPAYETLQGFANATILTV